MGKKLCFCLAVGVLLVPSLASATVVVTLTTAGTTHTSAVVNRNLTPSYGLDLRMASTAPLGSWDGGLKASVPGAFSLTNVTPIAPWTTSDWDWASLYGVSQTGPLDPVSNSLGRFKPSYPDYPPGTYRVVALTIDISLAPNGEYTFTLDRTTNHGASDPYRYWSNESMIDPPSLDFDLIVPFTLTVVPEPSTLCMLVGVMLLRRSRRG